MARKLSSGARMRLLGYKPTLTAATLSGTSSTHTIADSANGLAIFRTGMKVSVSTALVAAGYATVATVAVTGASMTVTETVLDQSAGASYTITCLNGQSLSDLFNYSVLEFFSANQATDADTAEPGSAILRITKDGGAFVPGVSTNGIQWDTPTIGTGDDLGYVIMTTKAADSYYGLGLIAGTQTALSFRLYDNMYTTGASTTAVRLDGSVGASGQLVPLTTLQIVYGVRSDLTRLRLKMKA